MTTNRPFPPYRGESYDFSTSMGHRLVELMGLMRREVELRMVEHGLTDAQWKPLWMLSSGMATTAFELAREMGCDAGAVTRLLDRLEAKGLVERLRSETDRRVVHLHLTDEGKAAAAKVPYVLAEVNNAILAGFTEAEWKQLGRLLDRMIASGHALQAGATEVQA